MKHRCDSNNADSHSYKCADFKCVHATDVKSTPKDYTLS